MALDVFIRAARHSQVQVDQKTTPMPPRSGARDGVSSVLVQYLTVQSTACVSRGPGSSGVWLTPTIWPRVFKSTA
jgi:hypothetical protein